VTWLTNNETADVCGSVAPAHLILAAIRAYIHTYIHTYIYTYTHYSIAVRIIYN
jgi:hypothetical protein